MTKLLVPIASLSVILSIPSFAQTSDLLQRGVLDAFREVGVWRGVKEVSAVEGKCEFVINGEGKVLVNAAKREEKAPYLITKEEFGDVRIELEFMVPKNSNAGVYVAGRYEVQILDSFGRENFGFGDLGGIYQRYDPSLPKGKKGFGGIAPKVNASRAPGEWQTMEIVFRAPRFDAEGKKFRDATFEKVLVNGILVQEGATTGGHTRSAPLEGDAATGPIAIQGDHGPIAIRSFKVTSLPDPDETRIGQLDAYWAEISRSVREGDFEAYKASCHEDAVLVSGTKKESFPLTHALAKWKQEFDDTKAGLINASVEFRFSHRYSDATTAHESGVFHYTQKGAGEAEAQSEYIGFEALLLKEADGWKMMMEYQKGALEKADWDALSQ